MANVTQQTRPIAMGPVMGEDVLLLRGFTAHERMSGLFEIQLDLLSETYDIEFNDIIGKNVTLRLNYPEGGERYWNGFINRFVQGRSTSTQFAEYRATMVPWMWFLTLTSDCRIFQDMTVPDIIKQICEDKGFGDIEERLSGSYRPWTYCVQYRETAFNFISRLMEQEGIYYYWKHEDGKHTAVLTDVLSNHDPSENDHYHTIEYKGETRGSSQQEVITEWTVNKSVQPGLFVHKDFNFETPDTLLLNNSENPGEHDNNSFEIYDYPGEYPDTDEGNRLAEIRMQELAHGHETCSGQSDSRGIATGYKFTLDKHPRQDRNGEYLVTSTVYHATAEDYETSGGTDSLCACSFTALPGDVQFRPPRVTPKPSINGTQTAIVTGPSGEEIWTNEYGQIKVQFHWDRYGEHDENSSCWVRVRQNWAGNGWGGIHIPRIGQEVVVGFIEGDPDRPIVLGAVYHGQNLPPYSLPDEKTKSTLKSDSSVGGGGFNEIRMEDKKGDEQLFIHAEKNQDARTKERMAEWVGKSRHLIVGGSQKEQVGGDKHVTVKKSLKEKIEIDKHLTVTGNCMEVVQAEKHLNAVSYDIETVDFRLFGHSGVNITSNSSINLDGPSITIKAGNSFITLGPGGVDISGSKVNINSGGAPSNAQNALVTLPEEPEAPHEADTAEPGGSSAAPPAAPPPPTMAPPQFATLRAASQSGKAFCDL